jgi:F0F1-type ATP synthase alpha subunit
MDKVISISISEHDHRALEAASKRDGVDILEQAAKMLARGLGITELLPQKQVQALDDMVQRPSTVISQADAIAAFERKGSIANALELRDFVESEEFQNAFRQRVLADQAKAKAKIAS